MSLVYIVYGVMLVLFLVVVSVVALIINNRKNMDSRSSAKDFFINLGAIVALYTTVVSLLSLLFTVINAAYPQVNSYSYFGGSGTISWPVATIIIFFPIFILLMRLLEQDYKVNPEKQNSGVHRWMTYVTLFVAGLTIAIDLITVLYYFLDGQELTTGFLLKVLSLLVVATGIFSYYLYDVLGKLTAKSRNIYRVIAIVIVLGSIIWGFSVLGSPRTQRAYKYDEQRVSDLMNIGYTVESFYQDNGKLPETLSELQTNTYFYGSTNDPESGEPYEYAKTGANTYNLCAEFNKANPEKDAENSLARPLMGNISWTHPSGHHCFAQTINPNTYSKPVPMRAF